MENKVIGILSHYTEVKPEEITVDSELIADLAFNSLDVVNAVVEFEDEFDFEIPDEDIKNLKTVNNIVMYIKSH